MSFKNQLIYSLSKFQIRKLTAYMVAMQLVLAFLTIFQVADLTTFIYNINFVTSGEFWRVITFVVEPGILGGLGRFVLFLLFAYSSYFFGQAIQDNIGQSKYTWYIFTNYLLYLIAGVIFPNYYFYYPFYISIFIAFGFIFPNFIINLYGILPIKAKLIGYLFWLIISYNVFFGIDWNVKIIYLIPAIPFFMFFGKDLFHYIKYKKRRAMTINVVKKIKAQARHTCVTCGKTDVTNPDLQFKYKVTNEDQTICYCEEHYT